ncbi:hypothetical protein KVM92_03620 [Helicobacter pylori]|nr:hypothetical protein KVM92_03620 [Helicobacter pylori]
MKQKVHSVSYLAKAEFECENGVYDLVALPAGAEVVKVSLEVAGNFMDGYIYIGFKDESTKKYFLTFEQSYTTGEVKYIEKTITSDKDYTATSNKVVAAEVHATKQDYVKCILRVVYFLPKNKFLKSWIGS